MKDLDSQLIFENYYSARINTLNEGLLDAIKNKFKDFTADVIRPYAIKSIQFIAKKDPALAKQIAQAVKSKNLESLKNILKPGVDELSQGAKVNTEDLQTIRNFLNTGFGKGIKGAILALAAFTVVTGGLSGEDIDADGTIDTVTVDDGDPGTTTLAEFEQMMKDAGVNVFDNPDDIMGKIYPDDIMAKISDISGNMGAENTEFQKISQELDDQLKGLKKLELQGKIDALKLKQYNAESDAIQKQADSGRITADEFDKKLNDLDKKYGVPSLDQLRQIFK
tara:strand:+ start:469 stop:1308 length:840 start_codon:yes stop_codon:yes gene_type:complete